MESRSVGRLLFEFSMPSIIASVIGSTYNFVARIFVGQSIGPVGVAALGISFPIILLQLSFAMMVGTGASTLIAIRLGERRLDEAERVLAQGIVLYALLSILFLSLSLPFLEPLLRLFGATDSILPYAKEYLKIVIWGTFFSNMSYGVNNFIRSEGKPRTAMVTMLISGALNFVLVWLFLRVFHSGIWGAAVANIIALVLTTCWVVWLYLSGKTVLRWRLKYFRFNLRLAWDISVYGMVPLVTQGCSALVQGVQNNLLGFYGAIYGVGMGLAARTGSDLAISVLAVIYPINLLILMPILGLGQGMQPIVGYNVGSGRPDRVLRTLRLSVRSTMAICLICWLLVICFPHPFFACFVRSDDPMRETIMALGSRALRIMAFCIPAIGLNIITGGYFQAHGRPILSLMLTLARQLFILLPALYLVPRVLTHFGWFTGLDGVWGASPFSDFLAALISVAYLVREYRIKKRTVKKMRS